LLRRGRLIDPRRFTAGEAWRAAIILPVAMALGALGVVADFRPELAVLVVTVALGVLIWRTRQPAPLGAGSLGDWVWGAAIGVVLVAAAVLATWAAWHGLLDHPGLPAPTPGGES